MRESLLTLQKLTININLLYMICVVSGGGGGQ